jgi:hypothetical protein
MAATLFVPFEWNPTSTTIKTSTYTVPMGYRARVRPTSLETDFTIDAVVTVEKTHYTGSSASSGIIFTNTSCYTLAGGCVQNNTRTVYVEHPSYATSAVDAPGILRYPSNGNGTSTTSTTANNQKTGSASHCSPTLTMVMNSKLGVDGGTTYYALDAIGVQTPDWFWVPEDTDLNGSRYVVELYANIA